MRSHMHGQAQACTHIHTHTRTHTQREQRERGREREIDSSMCRITVLYHRRQLGSRSDPKCTQKVALRSCLLNALQLQQKRDCSVLWDVAVTKNNSIQQLEFLPVSQTPQQRSKKEAIPIPLMTLGRQGKQLQQTQR